jgi:hemoglobin-like flavoprotein
MTPRQIALIKQTWQQMELQADAVADFFYARLFELDPTLRALFKRDMRVQRRMLMSVIKLAVSQLDRLDKLVPVVLGLGERHATYGVQDQHYGTVGAALLDTLAIRLQATFTFEVKEAWTEAYILLANTMKSGAAQRISAVADVA